MSAAIIQQFHIICIAFYTLQLLNEDFAIEGDGIVGYNGSIC